MRNSLILTIVLCLGTRPFSPLIVWGQDPPIPIGVSAPMTGDLAAYGTAVKNGIELANEDTPALRSQVNFIIEDNRYSSAEAVKVFRKLVRNDHAQVIYNWGEAPLYAVAPLAEREKVAVVAMSIDAKPAEGNGYIVRSINHPDQYAETLLAYTRSKGYRRIGIVKTEDPFLNALVSSLQKQLRDGEELRIIYSTTPEQSDFKIAASIVQKNQGALDCLGVYLLSGQVGAFYKHFGARRLSLPTFGTDVFESQAEIESAGGFMEGAVYPNVVAPDSFIKTYVDRYHDTSEIAFAYNAYIFANLMGIVSLETRRTGASILDLLLSLPAAEIPFAIRGDRTSGHFFEFPLRMRRISNGTPKTME